MMMRTITKYFITIIALVCAVGGTLYWYGTNLPALHRDDAAVDVKNATYEIQEKSVTLVNGSSIVQDTPSSQTVTAYFGNEARGDLDNDGDEDVAFILIQNGGGSGTFVYVVAALLTPGGYVGTNGILLGDRIAPQTTEVRNGQVIVNFADRRPDEPMTTQPSIGITLRARIEAGRLVIQ